MTQEQQPSETAKRIIIVDDDPDVLMLIGVMLKNEGYVVDTAHDGEEALQKIAVHAPDVILLDIMMPRMNGVEVAKKLKADAATDTIPIIFLTALTDRKYMQAALFQLGVTFYITKPIDFDDLFDKVRQCMRYRTDREVRG